MTKMDLQELIADQTSFALTLSNHVSRSCASAVNLAFSPISFHAILSIIAVGSRGPTRDQMLSFVRSKSDGDLNDFSSQVVGILLADGSGGGGPRISFVNAVWVDKSVSIKEGFKEIVTKSFRAEVKGADFQRKAVEVENEVNSWVENASAGLIKELIPFGSINSNTRLVLGNALYFECAWETKFDPAETQDSEFFLLDKTSVQVPFMTSQEDQFISSYDDLSVLRLPYKQGRDRRQFSLYVFLSHAKDGLWNLSEKLSSKPGFLDHHLPRKKAPVGNFKIPKFKISFGFEASEVLKGLGLVLPFSKKGDLTEMVDSVAGSDLYVSSIFHKSFVEVNEEGTEAAGASATILCGSSAPFGPSDLLDFVADHPFVFVIREDVTGVLLFTGHVLNPLLSG